MGVINAGLAHTQRLSPSHHSLSPIPHQSHAFDDASAHKSARMDELRSNLQALTIDFSGAPPSSHLRNRPPQPPRADHAAAASVDDGHEQQRSATPPPPPPTNPKSSAPQPFRRAKAKI